MAEKNGPSAAISVVAGSARASVGSSDLNGGYRLLAGCRNPIIRSQATRSTRPWTAFVLKPRRSVGSATSRRTGSIVRTFGYHGAYFRIHGVQIGAGRTTGGIAKEIDLNRRGSRTAEPLGPPGIRNRVAIRVPAITSKTVPKNQLSNETPSEGTNDIPW